MSEIRRDIITGEHVVIAIERGKRPHDFQNDEQPSSDDEYCPFCYGNEEDTPPEIMAVSDDPNRKANQTGWKIRVVPNKFAAFDTNENLKEVTEDKDGFYKKLSGFGAAEVLIESNQHNDTFGTHSLAHVEEIIKALKERHDDLRQDQRLKYVQIFKNVGGTAGASLEHPHWQIMATPVVPAAIRGELAGARDFYQQNKSCVYCKMLEHELNLGVRVVEDNDKFVVFNPYASRRPFETWIVPKQHQYSFKDITTTEIKSLAKSLKQIVRKLEIGFNNPPFNIILHTTPFVEGTEEIYHWHIGILPRLAIAAGFELGTGNYINPTPPELATQSLKEINIH